MNQNQSQPFRSNLQPSPQRPGGSGWAGAMFSRMSKGTTNRSNVEGNAVTAPVQEQQQREVQIIPEVTDDEGTYQGPNVIRNEEDETYEEG